MPDSAADSYPPSSRVDGAPSGSGDGTAISAPQAPPTVHHHAPTATASFADSSSSSAATSLPQPLTPATTTRQSIALGVLSTLWGTAASTANSAASSSNTLAVTTTLPLPDPSIPAIITHAPQSDTQEHPSDLTTSTSSVPSTTTTLTNTLPPTHSAALRALNAPAFQSHASNNPKNKSAKSASSRTTLSSQPVVVRTYSGSRHNSRPSSGVNSPRNFGLMNGNPSASALSAGLAGRTEQLPSVEDFSFSAILRAVDPEIRDAIDAIAEICARSRMSLADEYDAHLPPQGEITGTGPGWAAGMGALVGRGRVSRIGQGWSATENTLTAVPEASSSSERLAGESSRGGVTSDSKKRSQSAYGSLKSVISGGSGKRKSVEGAFESIKQEETEESSAPAWAVHPSSPSSSHPAITLVVSPQASKQLSLDTSSTVKDLPEVPGEPSSRRPQTAASRQGPSHRRNISDTSLLPTRTRSSTLSSIASWLPWPRTSELDASTQQELTNAEARLREVLTLSQNAPMSKGKAPVSVA